MAGEHSSHSSGPAAVFHGNADKVLQVHTVQGDVNFAPADHTRPWARILGSLHPGLKSYLVEHELLPMPKGRPEEQAYLEWLRSELSRLNLGDLSYVPLAALPGGEQTGDHAYAGSEVRDLRAPMRRIRSQLRLLQGRAAGGDEATAEIAAAGRPSRTIHDAARWLAKTVDPVILLGDPGSGKSTTLREVGIAFAERGRRRVAPLIPLYVSLAGYRGTDARGEPEEVMDLVRSAIPPSHQGIREGLEHLIRQRRLVLLFDAMDEMERAAYSRRVEKLSEFASSYSGRIRSIFACRTNDFIASFKHRQLVLLPLSHRQIISYIKFNFPSPLTIDGTSYSPWRAARLLMASDEFNDVITNPLTLYLLREYLTDHDAWPRDRNELFETYVDKVLRRGIAAVEGPAQFTLEQAKEAMARVAFAIATIGGGAYIEVARLANIFGSKSADGILRAGFGSGILSIDPYKAVDFGADRITGVLLPDDSVGFFHHRIQEYLCAHYLSRGADERSALDWNRLLDNPRWQETLLHLALMPQSDSAPWDALRQTLVDVDDVYAEIAARKDVLSQEEKKLRQEREAIKPDRVSHSRGGTTKHYSREKTQRRADLRDRADRLQTERLELKPAAGQERRLADRTLLSARAFAIKAELLPGDDELVRKAVRTIADQGRPTSQVKMLLAWKDASRLIPAELVEVPRRSSVTWVRNQAILAFAKLAGTRKHPDVSLRDELEFDFAVGHIHSRAAVYVKAADGRPGQIALLLWAVLTYSGCRAALFAAAVATIFLTTAGLPDWQGIFAHAGRPEIAGLITAFFLIPVLLMVPLGLRRFIDAFAWVAALGCTGLVAAAFLVDGYFALPGLGGQRWAGGFWSGVARNQLLVVIWPLIAVAIARIGSFTAAFLLLQLPLLAGGGRDGALPRLNAAFRRFGLRGEIAVAWLAAAVLLLAGAAWCVIALIPYWPASATAFFKIVGDILVAVVFAVAVLLIATFLVAFLRDAKSRSSRLLVLAGLTLIVALPFLVTYISPYIYAVYPPLFNFLGAAILGLLLVCAGLALALVAGLTLWEVARGASKSLRRWADQVYWFLPGMFGYRRFAGAIPAEEAAWVSLFSIGNPYLQRIMLENVSPRKLGLSDDRTLLTLLERCEPMVRREPALSAYWRKYYDVEAAVSHTGAT